MSELYISVDVETDGPIPGPNSMLSLGAYAFQWDKHAERFEGLGTFSVNLEQMEGSTPDPDTMEWWSKQGDAWAKTRAGAVSPGTGMVQFVNWADGFGKKPVFVAYPAGFDFLFAYWYMIRFVGRSPFSFSALDIKTYGAAVLHEPYRNVTKRLLKPYLPNDPHTHVAVEDAIEQGKLFQNLFLKNRNSL